ncbi:MAG: acyltransferase [Planctomycetes bacterium]|nr:acyltransferase [Planctomycetota bacterium]
MNDAETNTQFRIDRKKEVPLEEKLKNRIEDRAEECRPADISMIGFSCRFIMRAWKIGLTRLVWGWRLNALGSRSVFGRSLQVNNPRTVAIGSRVTISEQFILADLCPNQGKVPKIIIGDGCIILYRFQCNVAQSVRIGRNVLIASNVLVTDSDHVIEPAGLPVTKNGKFLTRPVFIEDNCWIGQNAAILKGVTIGQGSIVGANSVVTHNVPSHSVVAGNPARIIKKIDVSVGTDKVQK